MLSLRVLSAAAMIVAAGASREHKWGQRINGVRVDPISFNADALNMESTGSPRGRSRTSTLQWRRPCVHLGTRQCQRSRCTAKNCWFLLQFAQAVTIHTLTKPSELPYDKKVLRLMSSPSESQYLGIA
jgi:hypothetical protein